MSKGAIKQTGFDKIACSGCSGRSGVWISIVWVASLLLVSWVLSSWFTTARAFESPKEFQAHNDIHWFRPIAVFWFDRFSLFPSTILAIFICARHARSRDRRFITWTLA